MDIVLSKNGVKYAVFKISDVQIFLGGFFVEAGGHNFEDGSTSLHFELKHNWTVSIINRNKRT